MDAQQVGTLEQRLVRLQTMVGALGIGFLVLLVATVAIARRAWVGPSDLTVRSVAVVDANGVTRVRLAAPLPEPTFSGKPAKRDDQVSGVMIYDAAGDERGGYVTDSLKSGGNAFITLDSKESQMVTLVAYPHEGAELGVTRGRGNFVVLRSLEEGSSIAVSNKGQVSFKQPQ